MKSVTSDAERYLVAKINAEFTKPDRTPPQKKQYAISFIGIKMFPAITMYVITITKKEEIRRHGIISR